MHLAGDGGSGDAARTLRPQYTHCAGPSYVVILYEMIPDARLIPLDGRPHVAQRNREVVGDWRGHWKGNTRPTAFTRLWTARIPLSKAGGPVFKYACHQGNYALTLVPAKACAAEKRK